MAVYNDNLHNIISDELLQGFAKQGKLTGKEKAAILFSELGVSGTGGMLEYFSTAEIKKLRKALMGLPAYNIHQVTKENRVLEETLHYGNLHGFCAVNPELLSSAQYFRLHENDSKNNYMKNLSANTDAIASVLSVWLKEDK